MIEAPSAWDACANVMLPDRSVHRLLSRERLVGFVGLAGGTCRNKKARSNLLLLRIKAAEAGFRSLQAKFEHANLPAIFGM